MSQKPRRGNFGTPRPDVNKINQVLNQSYHIQEEPESEAAAKARREYYQDPLNYFGWFLNFYGPENFRTVLEKERQWELMVLGIKKNRSDWEGFFLEEFNHLITSHTCLQGNYEGLSHEDIYQEARLETLSLIRKTEITDIKTLPGLLSQHLTWWFSNYCTRLNAKKLRLQNLQEGNSKLKGKLRQAISENKKDKQLPGEKLWVREKSSLLQKCLSELEADQRQILQGLFVERLTEADLAAKLNYSQSQISRKKHEALQALRDNLLQEGIPQEAWLEF